MKVTVKKSADQWRTKRWMVRYFQDRKAKRKFFGSKEEAEQHAHDLRQTFSSGVRPDDIAEAMRLAAGTGYRLSDLVKAGFEWLRSTEATAAKPSITYGDAAARFLANAIRLKRRPKTIKGYKSCAAISGRVFGSRIAATITAQEVEAYLDTLPDRRGTTGRASASTKETYLGFMLGALRAVGIKDPLAGIVLPESERHEVQYFSNQEIIKILGASRPSERGLLALGIFAAIRPEALERLPAECVNVTERTIVITPDVAKDKRRHLLEGHHPTEQNKYLPGLPDILWTWLEKYPFKPLSWSSRQKRLKKALGGHWIQDGLRHTGATNYRALFGRAATAELLTHTGTSLVPKHYDGVTTRANAIEFYSITPETVQFKSEKERSPRYDIDWPADEDLENLLREHPAEEIAKKLGCSGAAISKRCRVRGIQKPGRGAWAKAERVPNE